MPVVEAVAPQKQEDNTPAGTANPRYAQRFVKGLVGDNKFWSRFGAVFSGINLLGQGVVGGLCVFSPGLATQIAHVIGITALSTTGLAAMPLIAQAGLVAGSIALIGIGLSAIGLGFPGAWQRLEKRCADTFPKFNPLRKIREPFFRGRRKKQVTQPEPKGPLSSLKSKFKEHHMDVFLSGVTLEGSTVAALAWPTVIVAIASAPLSVLGCTVMAWAAFNTVLCTFDIFNSSKTLVQAYKTGNRKRLAKRSEKRERKAVHIAPPPVEKAKALPAAATQAFNDNVAPVKSDASLIVAPAEKKFSNGINPR